MSKKRSAQVGTSEQFESDSPFYREVQSHLVQLRYRGEVEEEAREAGCRICTDERSGWEEDQHG